MGADEQDNQRLAHARSSPTQTSRERTGGDMSYTKVKREVPVCTHEPEDIPPVSVMFIDQKGRYRHAEPCAERLDYLGACQNIGSETEVRFWCSSCLEFLTLPITALGRVVRLGEDAEGDGEVRTGDRSGASPHHSLARLLSVGNPVSPNGDGAQLPRAVSVKGGDHEVGNRCRLCNLPHYAPPAASTR